MYAVSVTDFKQSSERDHTLGVDNRVTRGFRKLCSEKRIRSGKAFLEQQRRLSRRYVNFSLHFGIKSKEWECLSKAQSVRA